MTGKLVRTDTYRRLAVGIADAIDDGKRVYAWLHGVNHCASVVDRVTGDWYATTSAVRRRTFVVYDALASWYQEPPYGTFHPARQWARDNLTLFTAPVADVERRLRDLLEFADLSHLQMEPDADMWGDMDDEAAYTYAEHLIFRFVDRL